MTQASTSGAKHVICDVAKMVDLVHVSPSVVPPKVCAHNTLRHTRAQIGASREQRERDFMHTRDMTQAGRCSGRWLGGQTPTEAWRVQPVAADQSYGTVYRRSARIRPRTASDNFSRSSRAC